MKPEKKSRTADHPTGSTLFGLPHWQVPTYTTLQLKPSSQKYAVVIPVLNEGERIRSQLERLSPHTRSLDIFLVDGSTEELSVPRKLATELGMCGILRVQERGLGRALRVGLGHCLLQNYQGIITVDGNGKDDVSFLPRFVEQLEQGKDFVQGSRFLPGGGHQNTPVYRTVGIHFFLAPLLSLAGNFRFTDPTNGFKGLSRRLLLDPKLDLFREELAQFNLQFYLNKRVGQIGAKIAEIPVIRNYPASGKTPTHIVGFETHSRLLKQLIATVLGKYDPR